MQIYLLQLLHSLQDLLVAPSPQDGIFAAPIEMHLLHIWCRRRNCLCTYIIFLPVPDLYLEASQSNLHRHITMCISISIGHNNTDDASDFLFTEEFEQNRHVIAAAAVSVDVFAPLRAWRILFNLQIRKSHILQDTLKLQRGETLIDLILSNL